MLAPKCCPWRNRNDAPRVCILLFIVLWGFAPWDSLYTARCPTYTVVPYTVLPYGAYSRQYTSALP